jgi:hypothetical protein
MIMKMKMLALSLSLAVPLTACASTAEDTDEGTGAMNAAPPADGAGVPLPGACDGPGMTADKVAQIIKQQADLGKSVVAGDVTTVPMTAPMGEGVKVQTWGPSTKVHGQWEPTGALKGTWPARYREKCVECRGGFRDVEREEVLPFDRANVFLSFNHTTKAVSIHFTTGSHLTTGKHPVSSKGGEIVVPTYDPAAKKFAAVSEHVMFSLDCKVDSTGAIECPSMRSTGVVPESGARNFFSLQFAGRVTNSCLRVSSTTADDAFGVTLEARL